MTVNWRAIRLIVAGALLIPLVAALLLAPPPAAAAPRIAPDPNQAAISALSSCANSGRSLSALFLLDKSSSLGQAGQAGQGTDPKGVRYDGLRAALEALWRSSKQNRDLPTDVAVAAFSDGYASRKEIVNWTGLAGLDPKSKQEVIDSIVADTQRETDPFGGTNFQDALDGALKDFTGRAGRESCRLLLWFTDGLDDDPWHINSICRPDGLADQARKQGITMAVLHLTNSAQGANSGDLPRIAHGKAGGQPCGTWPLPEGWQPGIYLDASDPSKIPAMFISIWLGIAGCIPTDELGKIIEPGITSARASFGVGGPVKNVRLDAPGGEVIVAPADGSFSQDGFKTVASNEYDRVSLELTPPAGKGIGTWRVTPGPTPVPENAISWCVISAMQLEKTSSAPLKAGEESTVTLFVRRPDGSPVDLSLFRSAVPAASAQDAAKRSLLPTATVIDAKAGEMAVKIKPGLNDARVDLNVTLDPTTRKGLPLPTLQGNWGLAVALSKDFPSVTPADQMVLPDAKHTDETSSQFTIIGSPEGATQVCFSAPENLVVPEEAAGTTLDYQTGCLDVAQGETQTVKVSVKATKSAQGDASANIPIKLVAAERNGRRAEAEMAVPVFWRFTTPVNAPRLLWVLFLAIAASILLPILAMSLAKWLTSRYDVTNLLYQRIPVVVRNEEPVRQNPIPGQPRLLVDSAELNTLSVPGSRKSHLPGGLARRRLTRRFEVDNVKFEVRQPAHPFRDPYFVASVPAGYRLASSAGPVDLPARRTLLGRRVRQTARPGEWAGAAPAFSVFWAFVATDSDLAALANQAQLPGAEQARGTLYVLSDPRLPADVVDLIVRTRGDWAGQVSKMRSLVPGPGDAGNPGWDGMAGSTHRTGPGDPGPGQDWLASDPFGSGDSNDGRPESGRSWF